MLSNLSQFVGVVMAPRRASVFRHIEFLSLSERRAKAVVSYLSERGVDAAKLQPRGYGQSKPVVADPYSGDNRRVETRIRVD